MEKTIRQIAREKAVIAVYQWLTVDASKKNLRNMFMLMKHCLKVDQQNNSVIG